jgi:hypothetical protein
MPSFKELVDTAKAFGSSFKNSGFVRGVTTAGRTAGKVTGFGLRNADKVLGFGIKAGTQTAVFSTRAATKAYDVGSKFFMGNKPLFYEREIMRKGTLTKELTFNTTLRKRYLQGAVGLAAAGGLVSSYNLSKNDPRIPVYDETLNINTGSQRRSAQLGGTGQMALSSYYNNK